MKIEIEVSDIELFAKALNNAFLAYWDITSAIDLGLDPQIRTTKFLPLGELPDGELKNRFEELERVYLQVEEIERRMLNDQKRANHEENAGTL